ncbi:peptidase M48 [Halobacteriales archaeon QS_8_69_26]|nr:MAG: peptidase M48 [Halobacteriales archaeon QS_8_69_26]
MSTHLYHALFVVLLVGTEAFFSALAIVNLRHGERTVREEREWVEETLDVEDTERLTDYHRAKTGLSLLQSWVLLAGVLLVLYSGLFADAVAALQGTGLGELGAGVVFVTGAVVLYSAAGWPFDLVDTFVVEEIFDFNNQTPRLWVRDRAVSTAITVALVAPLTAAVLWLVGTVGPWWLAVWALYVVVSLALQVLIPRVIAPLFYDFEPIEEGELRTGVEDVFERAGFRCEQVYEMDASRRSSHSNAFFSGFGRTKRVVLFDTLVEHMELPEVQSVLAHELAHWKKGHIWKLLAAGAVQAGVVLAALQFLLSTEWLYAMFGVPETTHAGLLLALLWVLPVTRWTAPLQNRLSLAHEREADSFAVDVMGAGEPMADALSTLAGENLSNPFPHPWYAAFHHSHPPIPERIRYVREMAGETDDSGTGSGGDPAPDPT